MLLDHLNSFSGGYEAQLRDAIHGKCRQAGHHLLLVYGMEALATTVQRVLRDEGRP